MNSTQPIPASTDLDAFAPLCAVFRRFLRSKGLKYTPERADVLNAIIERDGVFEVDQLMDDLRAQGGRVSKATVYRTIKLLQEAGIITLAIFDARQSHYRLVYGRQPHDSIVCVRSGRSIEFNSEELARLTQRICAEHGWRPLGHRFQIYAMSPGSAEADGAPNDDAASGGGD